MGHFGLSASGATVHPILVVIKGRGPPSLTSAAFHNIFFLDGERVTENGVQSLGHVHLLWPLSTHYASSPTSHTGVCPLPALLLSLGVSKALFLTALSHLPCWHSMMVLEQGLPCTFLLGTHPQQRQSCSCDRLWLTEPKIFTVWPLTGKVCQSNQ